MNQQNHPFLLNRTLRNRYKDKKYSIPKVVRALPILPRKSSIAEPLTDIYSNRKEEDRKLSAKQSHIKIFNKIFRDKSKSYTEGDLRSAIRMPFPKPQESPLRVRGNPGYLRYIASRAYTRAYIIK
jgi:hypothetical protein